LTKQWVILSQLTFTASFFKKKEELAVVANGVDYKVEVLTSDIKGAGTNAKVFIILYGQTGDTGKGHQCSVHNA
jgi:hypothetical protein